MILESSYKISLRLPLSHEGHTGESPDDLEGLSLITSFVSVSPVL